MFLYLAPFQIYYQLIEAATAQ